MSIGPHETEIVGAWILRDGKVSSDAACQRIEALTQTELAFIAKDKSGWEALYLDKDDGRYWERTFPHGELQGGGPPALRVIAFKDAAPKYGLSN
jgi:Immunity protein 27